MLAAIEFGEKVALSLDELNDYARESFRAVDPNMIRPASLTALLGGMAASGYAGYRFNQRLRALKKAKRGDHQKLLRYFKLKDMPIVRYPGLDNAAYIEQRAFQPGLLSRGMHVDDDVLRAAIAKKPKILENAKKHGLVVYDGRFNTPAIMAHEAGHADISHMPWYSPSRVNQSYLRSLAGVAGFAAQLLGGAAGVLTRNPLLGLGAGALTGAVLNAPTLINEWQATNRANKYIDDKVMTDDERKKSKKTLGAAFNTYLAAAAAPAAIMGAAGGLAWPTARS